MDTENVGDWHISPLELLHSGPLLDFDLLPGCCSSMAALSLPSLPNVKAAEPFQPDIFPYFTGQESKNRDAHSYEMLCLRPANV
ncbi:hypothetical protein HID58_018240 [Brassica napus]|uniref:Uncharacterized protein n=1 Tax=Brassica napus TaxID=3708 RepID=A0ABQ7X2V2_BRANA|nr:hypothetical protein HID58_095687 [Brassica napus]KAH0852510.1 hypothetical protein HID58_093965 [Brassica napus]KAH0925984.1 hypothetical protein HID58_018240 [Brassica napus]